MVAVVIFYGNCQIHTRPLSIIIVGIIPENNYDRSNVLYRMKGNRKSFIDSTLTHRAKSWAVCFQLLQCVGCPKSRQRVSLKKYYRCSADRLFQKREFSYIKNVKIKYLNSLFYLKAKVDYHNYNYLHCIGYLSNKIYIKVLNYRFSRKTTSINLILNYNFLHQRDWSERKSVLTRSGYYKIDYQLNIKLGFIIMPTAHWSIAV